MPSIRASVVFVALVLSLEAWAQSDVVPPAPPKVTVLPFAALSGDVPQRSGQKAAAMLGNELKNLDTVQYIQPKTSTEKSTADKYADGISQARALVDEAKQDRQKRKFNAAKDALDKALALYRQNAAGLNDVNELSDAYALMSAVLFNTGRDDEGQKALVTAVSFAPSRDLPLAATSPLFSRVVLDTRKAVQLSAKGSILAESTPSGAQVTLDGVMLGATPLEVKDVPPGEHAWRVTLPSGELAGGVVDVSAGKQTKVSGSSNGMDPESRALSTLSQNKIDENTVKAIGDVARSSDAELVLFGGLSRDGKSLALDPFVYSLTTNELRRLPRMSFDTELLSAGMEFYNLAGELSKQGAKLGELTRAPTQVASQPLGETTKVAVATYGIPMSKGEGLEEGNTGNAEDQGPRKPLEPVKRKPLRR